MIWVESAERAFLWLNGSKLHFSSSFPISCRGMEIKEMWAGRWHHGGAVRCFGITSGTPSAPCLQFNVSNANSHLVCLITNDAPNLIYKEKQKHDYELLEINVNVLYSLNDSWKTHVCIKVTICILLGWDMWFELAEFSYSRLQPPGLPKHQTDTVTTVWKHGRRPARANNMSEASDANKPHSLEQKPLVLTHSCNAA